MEKIARTCIKNTKRIRRKVLEAHSMQLQTSDVTDPYIAVLKNVLNPDTPETPMDFEIFLKTFTSKEALINYCGELYANPYEAIKHLYDTSKSTLITLRNRIVYNK